LALAVAQQFGIPTAYLCTGEGYDDIRPFDADAYLRDFLGEP
jgi:fused signal recognition particle receptor